MGKVPKENDAPQNLKSQAPKPTCDPKPYKIVGYDPLIGG